MTIPSPVRWMVLCLRANLPKRLLPPVLVCLSLASAGAVEAQVSSLGPVPPGMVVRSDEDHYTIFGSTAAELRRSMRESGPTENGRRWDGYTTWNVQWRFRYAMRTGSCRITTMTVEYDSHIVLPRWTAPAGAPAPLRREWNEFARALRAHEEGHRNIGAEAARQVMRRIGALTLPSCTHMAAEANALGHRTLDEFRGRQRQYDEETGHGRTQGAVWPPR